MTWSHGTCFLEKLCFQLPKKHIKQQLTNHLNHSKCKLSQLHLHFGLHKTICTLPTLIWFQKQCVPGMQTKNILCKCTCSHMCYICPVLLTKIIQNYQLYKWSCNALFQSSLNLSLKTHKRHRLWMWNSCIRYLMSRLLTKGVNEVFVALIKLHVCRKLCTHKDG